MTHISRPGLLATAAVALLIGLGACKPVSESEDPNNPSASETAAPLTSTAPATAPAETTVQEAPSTDLPATDQAAPAAAEEPVPPEGYTVTPLISEEPVREFSEAGDALDDGKDYAVVIETSKGRIVADLLEQEVPTTVNSFVWLARNRYYDGIVFHRVIDGFMAQTGDPTGTGTGGPGYQFGDEIRQALTHDAAGILSMANAGPGTNGSQFFITFAPAPHLNGLHTVFGRVTEGQDVLANLTRIEPGQPGTPDVMQRVFIVEKPL